MNEWLWASAADLGRGIAAGGIDPVDLTETYLAAIDAHERTPRIYARVTHDRARSEAKAASERAKAGTRRSPLDGVPISWKDLFDSAGVATEGGSAFLTGRVPDQDALVLQMATEAGLVCLGKTHQTELAFSGLGVNPITASPPNVHDAALASGGSSSGAAASVAHGLAAAGIGSDTGGSVRIPSAWNDLVGLKTRHGRVSLQGVLPLCARFDTVGPLTRSVEDAALLFAVLSGAPAPDLRGVTLDGVHFADLTTIASDDLEGAPAAAHKSAVERLQAAGARVTKVDVPAVAEALAIAGTIVSPEAYGTWKHMIEAHPDKMHPAVRARFESGRDVLAADFVAAWQKMDQLRLDYAEAVAGYDAVILPSTPIAPPPIEALLADDEFFVSANLLALRNTRIGNLMGLACVTLPTGVPSCGLLVQGHSDEQMLRLGAAAEAALA